jgi:hypothetical protein
MGTSDLKPRGSRRGMTATGRRCAFHDASWYRWWVPKQDVSHFRNFMGPAASALCGEMQVRERWLTLSPDRANCEACLARLGRLQSWNIAAPPDPKKHW